MTDGGPCSLVGALVDRWPADYGNGRLLRRRGRSCHASGRAPQPAHPGSRGRASKGIADLWATEGRFSHRPPRVAGGDAAFTRQRTPRDPPGIPLACWWTSPRHREGRRHGSAHASGLGAAGLEIEIVNDRFGLVQGWIADGAVPALADLAIVSQPGMACRAQRRLGHEQRRSRQSRGSRAATRVRRERRGGWRHLDWHRQPSCESSLG